MTILFKLFGFLTPKDFYIIWLSGIPELYRNCITKIRISSHNLAIESGRFTGITRLNRQYIFCGDDIEDEFHFGFPSFPVVDWFCLFVDLWVLSFHLEDCSVFGNFVITLIFILYSNVKHFKVLEIIWLSHIIGKNLQCINLYSY